ncbi:WD40 repeat-like protein [Auricularia subglabra TFB-10046 SS5]|nr:WD40 repeat-like protein [Auricularia subglabra TFB-10046 SS5]
MPSKKNTQGQGGESGHTTRSSLHKLFGSVLGSSGSADSGLTSGDSGFPWHRSGGSSRVGTRAPSPAISDDFSLLLHPTREDDDDVRTHSELYERMRSRVSVDVPGCAPMLQRSGTRSHKHIFPRIWNSISAQRKDALGTIRSKRRSKRRPLVDEHGNLLPLDGEEGELIDDEACFVEQVEPVPGIDIISMLPVEIALYTLLFLDFQTLLNCHMVCRYWHQITSDNLVWRDLFYRQQGWRINRSIVDEELAMLASPGASAEHPQIIGAAPYEPPSPPRQPRVSIVQANRRASILFEPATETKRPTHSLAMDWMALYKSRLALQRAWQAGQPQVSTITGHDDSVYCIELDADKVVTGSRDRTIKIWSLRTLRLRQTLSGHEGSVLCLKFDRSGFMVSGSSDRTILVWDLHRGVSTAKLVGHTGGVLDIRIDANWIVSCSKDATIRVWSRKTLEQHCMLLGHDGPVNSIGLQDGKILSASGDGNMILWDIETQTRVRTFPGHDRGLACIEFKGDIIVSGANDALIRVWSASKGECLMTLGGHDSLVRALAYDPPSGRLVSASYDTTLKVWDLTKGKLLHNFKDIHSSHIFDVKFDASRIISTSNADQVKVLTFLPDVDTSVFL